jgi:excisionase family DNA binding protein
LPPYLSAKISDGARWGTFEDVEQTRRVSRSQQYKLIGEGKIVARKLGARTLIDLESVDAYLTALPDAKVAPSKPPQRKRGRA